jgi:hypothetical protein
LKTGEQFRPFNVRHVFILFCSRSCRFNPKRILGSDGRFQRSDQINSYGIE